MENLTTFEAEFELLMEKLAKEIFITLKEDLDDFNSRKKITETNPHFKDFYIRFFFSKPQLKGVIERNNNIKGNIIELTKGCPVLEFVYNPKEKTMTISSHYPTFFKAGTKSNYTIKIHYEAFEKKYKGMIEKTLWYL